MGSIPYGKDVIDFSEMKFGTVKFFNGPKEFGFVRSDNGKEYFLPKSGYNPVRISFQDSKLKWSSGDAPNPQKGDRIAFMPWEHSARGPKASNWIPEKDLLKAKVFLAKVMAPVKEFRPPILTFELLAYTGFMPCLVGLEKEAQELGFELHKPSRLLVLKQGDKVKDGVDHVWYDNRQELSPVGATISGCLPSDAADGWWLWQDGQWQKCEEVIVHATSVQVGQSTTSIFCDVRFISLRIESGQLVGGRDLKYSGIEQVLHTDPFRIKRPVLDNQTIPVVEMSVVWKAGWWDEAERSAWKLS